MGSPRQRPCKIPDYCRDREEDRRAMSIIWPDIAFDVHDTVKPFKPGNRSWHFENKTETVNQYVSIMKSFFLSTDIAFFDTKFLNGDSCEELEKKIWKAGKCGFLSLMMYLKQRKNGNFKTYGCGIV